jgi:molybdate transport system substrate-binding protein
MNRAATLISGGLVFALLGVIGACSGAESDGDAEVLVLAAASLTDVFEQLETAFEAKNPTIDVQLSFGASSAVRVQIEQGAPGDVVAVADTATMDALVAGGQVRSPIVFATNSMTIAVPPGNPGNITSLADFADDELLLGACAPEVPCGGYADRILARAGVDAALDTTEPDVRSLVAKIAQGELDAGLVYTTDVIASAGKLDEVFLDDESGDDERGDDDIGVRAEYPIAMLLEADSGAGTFVEFVLSEQGRQILADAGFGRP